MVLTGLAGQATSVLAQVDHAVPLMEFSTASGQYSAALPEMEAVYSAQDGGQLHYRLSPAQRSGFAEFTASSIGEKVVVSVCGATVLEVVMQSRIDSGVIVHPVTELTQAGAILEMVAGTATCPINTDE